VFRVDPIHSDLTVEGAKELRADLAEAISKMLDAGVITVEELLRRIGLPAGVGKRA
jgi:hypothetical protein